MPKARSVLRAFEAVALLLLAWSLAGTPVAAKPALRSQPTLALYGLAIPAIACAPAKKLSPDEKLCARRDEAACERLALAALQQPDRALDCAVWRALGRGFVSGEAVQSERLLRAVLGLVDRQVGGAAEPGQVHAAQLLVRRELLQRFAPPAGSELARGLRRDLALLGPLAPVADVAGCSAAAVYLKGQPRDGKAPVVEGFVPTALGALGPLVQPPWARLAQAVKASGDQELRGECGWVVREVVVELLVQPDWEQLGGLGQWQALVAAWIDGRPWQVELAEAAIARLCPEKATDAPRCERAALLGAGLVALAPLAAEAAEAQSKVQNFGKIPNSHGD